MRVSHPSTALSLLQSWYAGSHVPTHTLLEHDGIGTWLLEHPMPWQVEVLVAGTLHPFEV